MHKWSSNIPLFCMLCGGMIQNKRLLIKHLSFNHKIKCALCRASFVDENQISIHMELHGADHFSKADRNQSKPQKYMNITKHIETRNNNNQLKVNLQSHLNENLRTCSQPSSKNISVESNNQCEKCLDSFPKPVDLKKNKLDHHNVDIVNIPRKDVVSNFMNCSDDESVKSKDICLHLDVSKCTKTSVPKLTKNHLKLQKLSCSLCDFICNKKKDMSVHCRNKHSESDLNCEFQYESIKSASTLQRQQHQELDKKRKFPCDVCGNLYLTRSHLNRHKIVKHGEKRITIKLDNADIAVINQAKLLIDGTTLYQCYLCGRKLFTEIGLVRHIKCHKDKQSFTCHICGFQFQKRCLSRHIRVVHEGVKKYQCDICGQRFGCSGTRNDHRRTHTGERPYLCHICGKSFPSVTSVNIHRRTHTNNFPHPCTYCEKRFRTRQHLEDHTRTHTREKSYACDLCSKRFGVKSDLSRHKLIHLKKKPFNCTECGVGYSHNHNLNNHIKKCHPKSKIK